MKVELENILDIGTTLYSLDENFKIKRKEGSEYCREHKEYMEERQCQR